MDTSSLFFIIPVIIIALVLATAGVVLAVNSITIPAKANVVKATFDIEAYADPGCTIALPNPLVWSSLPTGESRSKTIYLKNTGNSDSKVVATMSPTSGVTIADDTSVTVPRGGTASLVLTLQASPSANIGATTITISLNASQANLTTTTTSTAP